LSIISASNVKALPFQVITFADPLAIDATIYKDWICLEVSANTTVNLTGVIDGDAGQIELIMDSVGGFTVTMGTMFTKQLGATNLDTAAGADNIISWRMCGTDIIYTIGQIV
jgi:hypothetical protein